LKQRKLKIVLDCGNGATSLVAPQVFKKFGFEVVELFCKENPNFPNRTPEPTFEATKILREKVKKEKVDFGVAFDGDGDRAVIVDDQGRYLIGNQIGIILSKEILKGEKNKKIVKTVSCTMALEEELKPLGAKIIEVPVGHTFVVSAAKKHGALIGIEASSHIVFPKYFLFDDAILVPLKVAEVLIKTRKKLSEIVNEMRIYPYEEINVECPDEKKFKIVEELKKEFKRKYKKVSALDGIKVYFNFGWVLIRVSNTSPIIRLFVEAKTKEKLVLLKEKFLKILKEKI
jgi:phosphomannomutase/phosphoglucomutase